MIKTSFIIHPRVARSVSWQFWMLWDVLDKLWYSGRFRFSAAFAVLLSSIRSCFYFGLNSGQLPNHLWTIFGFAEVGLLASWGQNEVMNVRVVFPLFEIRSKVFLPPKTEPRGWNQPSPSSQFWPKHDDWTSLSQPTLDYGRRWLTFRSCSGYYWVATEQPCHVRVDEA